MDETPITRRALIAGAAAAAGGALITSLPDADVQQTAPVSPPRSSAAARVPGSPTTAVGIRSPFVNPRRAPVGEITGTALTPLQELSGTITPSDLHFTRVHAGIPNIDPNEHTLTIHGLVDQPMTFTLPGLKRFPAVTHTYFIECSDNGRAAYRAPEPEMTPQQVDGMIGNSEWTGVRLSTLFQEVGVQPAAKWFLAEGGDACLLARSIPIAKGNDDALVAYAQNGEPIRPEQGYPIRLVLPGWEGGTNVKWLRRIELVSLPVMTRWETSTDTDPLPGGRARIFSFEMDAKSIINSPAYPDRLTGPGWWPVSGLAWSGRGRITRVDVSVDGGANWVEAELLTTAQNKATVCFQRMWQWKGDNNLLMSRAVDETGYVQPTVAQLKAVRGPGTDHHFNAIRGWRVARDGAVTFDTTT